MCMQGASLPWNYQIIFQSSNKNYTPTNKKVPALPRSHTQRVKFVRACELIHKESFESFTQMSEFAEAVIIFFFFKSRGVFGGFGQVPTGYQVWNLP